METKKRSFLLKCCYQNNIVYIVGAIGVAVLIIIGIIMSKRVSYLSSELANCRSSR